ncbi:MAG: phosphate acetyltransferase [Candidatus Omnitrophica bacterium]|nr:phosphate acetyltransferase [Candidatus Omnitrophota bacterium]
MSRIVALRETAKKDKKKIVLPEGADIRTLQAASFLTANNIVDAIVLGEKNLIMADAKKNNLSMANVTIVDPKTDQARKNIIDSYYELRKHKGITPEEAEKILLEKYVFYGAMMARLGMADGFVAGACHATSDIARAAIQCMELDREMGTLSSSFIMEVPNCEYGDKGLFVYGDCGVVPYPSAKQLAGIAIATSDLFYNVFRVEPKVALLSFSTKGSAEGESVTLVREALQKVKEKRPGLKIDGELQGDAALDMGVAAKKCKGSEVAGQANVLIFPTLDAGNIAYKLTQRLAGARAIGPLLQGTRKPSSDLSRGCSWEDIVDAAVVTACRAQMVK